jgi:anti-sigma factor ChrR (cupin superfamily)
MNPQHSLEEVQERAALYALGALRGEEARAFEAHLLSGCPTCAAEVQACQRVADELAHAAGPQAPNPSLRSRVMARIDSPEEPALLSRGGLEFVRSIRLPWDAGHSSGVEVKTLRVDHERGVVTKLVRMAPGATLRPHRHAAVEESYVLEGDLEVSGVLMRAGDYCRAEAGTVHADVHTRGGCTFLAIQSQRDEWLA